MAIPLAWSSMANPANAGKIPNMAWSSMANPTNASTVQWTDNTPEGQIRQKQEWAMNKQLSAIDALKNKVSSLGSAYADSMNQQTARSVGAFNGNNQTAQQNLQSQLASRGQANSGLAGKGVYDLERARQSGMADITNKGNEAIANRQFSDQMQQYGLENSLLSQQGNVLGNIQYPQIPTASSGINPYGDSISRLKAEIARLTGGQGGFGGGNGNLNPQGFPESRLGGDGATGGAADFGFPTGGGASDFP